MTVQALVAITVALVMAPVIDQDPHAQHKAGMDHRGHQAMGFDQARINHTFTTTDRGGTIAIAAKDPGDSATVTQIRSHLREISRAFKDGDFSKPVFIHAQTPPGVETLKARRAEIDYRFEEIPSGGKLAVTSGSAEAIAAIHAFLRFQQKEHK